MAGSPGTPSYTPNYFAGQSGGQSQAYANALRTYTPNSFQASSPALPALAPHLSQQPNLDPDILQAYRDARALPLANQNIPDIDKLWRMNPNAAIFKPGYQHNPYVSFAAQTARVGREQGEEMTAMGYMRDPTSGEWYRPGAGGQG